MKKIIALKLFLVCFVSSIAQQSIYDFIGLGEHSIGYANTVIYDTAIDYDQYGYSDKAPIFVQIWYPESTAKQGAYMKYGEFGFNHLPGQLSAVYTTLKLQMNDIFLRDGIDYNLETDDEMAYEESYTRQMLDAVLQIETRSSKAVIGTKLDFPAIVYHHGSQGLSDENAIMAEYFASHGYIFISGNFHLPYENTTYGLLPYNLEMQNKHDQSSAKAVLNYARSLNNNNKVFFIGHSWGAQQGWCFLNEPKWADAFVSMETTIEFKRDTEKIRELWPHVYDALKIKNNTFSIPVLAFAAAEESTNFDFFKGLNSNETIFASYKKPFTHNSYTSMILMRYFIRERFPQADTEMLLTQIEGYREHLSMIHLFFDSVNKSQPFTRDAFREHFILE